MQHTRHMRYSTLALLCSLIACSSTVSTSIVVPDIAHVSHLASIDGTYTFGMTIPIDVHFDREVVVTGAPFITLETGTTDRQAQYLSGSGSVVLTFAYVVQEGDSATDLDYTATDALQSNDGGITSVSDATFADLTLPAVGSDSSLGGTSAVIINGFVHHGPGAFAITSATAASGKVTLAWGASEGAVSYTVRYGTTSGSYPTTVSTNAISPMDVTGLLNDDTVYYFMVSAVDGDGSTDATAEASAMPLSTWTGIKQTGIPDYSVLGHAVSRDRFDNVFVVGDTSGDLIADTGPSIGTTDYFVTKYTDGVRQWVDQVGAATFFTSAASVAIDQDGNIFVCGVTEANVDSALTSAVGDRDYFIAKYNTDGERLWIKQSGVPAYRAYGESVTTDALGNIYVTGYTNGNLLTGTGPATGTNDLFVAKYNTDGVLLWTKQSGSDTNIIFGRSIAADPDGNIIVGGSTTVNVVTGSEHATGAFDYFITQYDTNGDAQWTVQRGVPSHYTFAGNTLTDASGNIYLGGYTSGNVISGSGAATGMQDCFIAKYTPSGTLDWIKQIGVTNAIITCTALAADHMGNVIVGGATSQGLPNDGLPNTFNTLMGIDDGFIIKYNASGAIQWTREFGMASRTMSVQSLCTDHAGNVMFLGYGNGDFTGTVFDGVYHMSLGKYTPVGELK